MEIAIIDGCTRTIGESQGYIGLPLRDIILNDTVNGPGTPAMESAWTASPLELEMLNAGAPVILCVLGKQHPPVMLSIGTPARPLYPRADVEGIAERIFDLMPFDGPDRTLRPAWVAGGTTARQEEARRYAQAALDVQRQTDLIRSPSPQAEMRSKPTIAVGTYTICELYAGRTVESDHVFMEPADDMALIGKWRDGEFETTADESAQAALDDQAVGLDVGPIIEAWLSELPCQKVAEVRRMQAALEKIASESNWSFGKPVDSACGEHYARIAEEMSAIAKGALSPSPETKQQETL
ncbi:hypothetical protein [Rhizobium sp. 9140]|uniref:hypothetical protein n=1 Tax=Rhizobium sp. 9140 TaxID=1761900 RepID=UPI0007921845|nr:hypothetical protein [Rhizobium sp. 9140]CZT36166.1 hypothetical protein GA0004734_00031680 [Rhizobium sp. 9140]